jgi:hypothetical protein
LDAKGTIYHYRFSDAVKDTQEKTAAAGLDANRSG